MEKDIQSQQEDKELLELAQKRVKRIKNFYTHLLIYTIGLVLYILKAYFGVKIHFFPMIHLNPFFMKIWTLIIVVQAAKYIVMEVILGEKWEHKKVNQIANKEMSKQVWE